MLVNIGQGGRFKGISAGDRVRYVDRFGKVKSGKAVIVGPAHVTLNIGGRYGTPAVVSDSNYMSHATPGGDKTYLKLRGSSCGGRV